MTGDIEDLLPSLLSQHSRVTLVHYKIQAGDPAGNTNTCSLQIVLQTSGCVLYLLGLSPACHCRPSFLLWLLAFLNDADCDSSIYVI